LVQPAPAWHVTIMSTPADPYSIRCSYRVYGALLRLYPRRFQARYGDDMALVFRDTCRKAYRQDGVRGLFSLWGGALLDLGVNVSKEVVMTLVHGRQPARNQQPAQACSSCNNEVAADWRKCIYCGETLIPAVLHELATHPRETLNMNITWVGLNRPIRQSKRR
jgi:hypothetical protein